MGQLDAKLTGMVEWSQDDVREAENDQVVMRALSEVQTLRGLLGEHQKFGLDHNQVRQTQKRSMHASVRRTARSRRSSWTSRAAEAGGRRPRTTSSVESLDEEIAKKTAEMNDFVAAGTLEKMRADLTRKEERPADPRPHRPDRGDVQSRGCDRDPARRQRPHAEEPASPKWFVVVPGPRSSFSAS